jgi:PAS domain S-box-containing protein
LIVLKNTEKLFNRSAKEKRTFADVYEGLSKACIIAMTDENGVIVDVNDKFTEISGHTKKEILGKTHRFLNSGLHPKEFFKEMWSHIKNKQVWSGEICNQKKNGDLYWVDTTIIPILNKKNVYQYLALRFDITEKKLADQKLSQSAKMASLGEMAGGIAHEINNPLAIIRGRAQLTLRSLQVEKDSLSIPSVEKSIVKIIDTSHRIEKIIHSLRTISRDGAEDPFQTNSLENIINEALYLSEERIRSHNISFHLDNENSDLKFLKVDCRETQILQVLINLISNAIDALDEQQEKWIELKVVVLSPDNKVQIRLTDNGCGITENIQNQVWQPFFTTKEPGKGTGLGLSLSKSFIDSHHGDFYIDTKVKNTCFVIELPIKQPISIKGVA